MHTCGGPIGKLGRGNRNIFPPPLYIPIPNGSPCTCTSSLTDMVAWQLTQEGIASRANLFHQVPFLLTTHISFCPPLSWFHPPCQFTIVEGAFLLACWASLAQSTFAALPEHFCNSQKARSATGALVVVVATALRMGAYVIHSRSLSLLLQSKPAHYFCCQWSSKLKMEKSSGGTKRKGGGRRSPWGKDQLS